VKIFSKTAKSIWLLPALHLNPQGVSVSPVFDGLQKKYSFQSAPQDNGTKLEKEGLQFERGTFLNKNGIPVNVNLTLHLDGVVVQTASDTEDGDLFLDDALSWVSENYKFAAPNTLPFKKIYSSEVFFELTRTPLLFEEKYQSFLADVSALVGNSQAGRFDFYGLQLSTDPAKFEKTKTFKIEREINSSFDSNRYYSFASTETKKHLALLEKFAALSAKLRAQ
jgi:hypothetical protein